jgi:hypothetical protein
LSGKFSRIYAQELQDEQASAMVNELIMHLSERCRRRPPLRHLSLHNRMGKRNDFFTIVTHNSHYVNIYSFTLFLLSIHDNELLFWVVNFSHFVKNIFNQEYSVANSMIFFEKKKLAKNRTKKIPKKNRQKKLAYKYERVLKTFLYFLILNIANFG